MEKETALQILKEIHDNGIFSVRTALETFIPELAESEDERIRKWLICGMNALKEQKTETFATIPIDDAIAWLEKQGEKDRFIKEEIECIKGYRENAIKKLDELEKQGEQKFEMKSAEESLGISSEEYNDIVNECLYGESNSSDKVEPKFKVGDWITDGQLICKVLSVLSKSYELHLYNDDYCHFETDVWSIDKDYHLWTIEDAKDGDILTANAPFIFNGNLEGGIGCPGAHCAINTLGKFQIPKYKTHWTGHITTPATKEQRDLLFQKMKEAGYEWDAEKKELKKINKNTDVGHEYFSNLLEKDDCDNIDDYAYQCAYCMSHDWLKATPTWDDVEKACKLGAKWYEKHRKSAWSEEDERAIGIIKIALEHPYDMEGKWDRKFTLDWLKSLNPQNKWKPSDEQMEALNDVISSRDIKYDVLSELWKDLNKLR